MLKEILSDNEFVYYALRKHPISLLRKCLVSLPIVFFVLWIVQFLWGVEISFIASMLILLLIYAWRWAENYYAVTDQRIMWRENITLKRRELLLADVLSVRATTDHLGRIFKYGIVELETRSGNMRLDLVQSHHDLASLISFFLEKSEDFDQKIKSGTPIDTLHSIIDKSIELELLPDKNIKEKGLFAMRFEKDGAIIYRKHLVNLFREAGMALMLTMFLAIVMLNQLYLLFIQSEQAWPSAFITLLPLGCMMTVTWMSYHYFDWKNDIYKITGNKVFEISRKPFGEEVSRSTSFQYIKSIEFVRVGILGSLFNFGTVYISVGSEMIEFEDVSDPAAATAEINARIKTYTEQTRKGQNYL